jgi:hypothetical protein
LLAALGFLALYIRGNNFRNLLLVFPIEDQAAALDPQKTEEIAGDEFLLTYEIRRQVSVSTAYGEHRITAIGTNSVYPFLMSYPLLRGSFFTKAAAEGKRREAVLNEAAAYRIFGAANIAGGTLRIDGALWLVTGLIDDGDEDNPQVYIPAPIRGEGPQSLLVLLNGGKGIDAPYVKQALRSLGITEREWRFFDLSAAAGLYEERFILALWSFICLCFAIFAGGRISALKAAFSDLRRRLKEKYPGELIRENRQSIILMALTVFALAGGTAFCFSRILKMAAVCLDWQDLPPLRELILKGGFIAKTAPLWDYYYPDILLLAAFFVLPPLMLSLTRNSSKIYKKKNS